MGRGWVALAALLGAAGCTTRPEVWPPTAINVLPPPTRYGAMPAPPPSYARLPPDRMAPFRLLPQQSYEEPSYAPEPEPEPPYSDGTPFSLDAPPAPEATPSYAPPVAETPPPVRATAPTSAVPMVGFRPMRSLGGKSY